MVRVSVTLLVRVPIAVVRVSVTLVARVPVRFHELLVGFQIFVAREIILFHITLKEFPGRAILEIIEDTTLVDLILSVLFRSVVELVRNSNH
jgi:hypothetical protein